MNNLLTTLAFSIYSNKGVYALLIGSGVSRKSGIPTGWDVVIDLIKRLAVVNNENCEPNPVHWFKEKYREDPDYSTILSKLASTPSERINLLKPYFEPTSEELEEGLKQPTKAHKSIAKLIKQGYVKVVITTNFDRLLETALQNEGIAPVVIRYADDIDGTFPLVHSELTIIKINGDYQDSRFLNTKKELSDYPEKLKKLILQIINEYGLISCGWSGKWDEGLLNTIRQSENFRFGSFWTHIGNCEPELADLALYRKGQNLEIQNADDFFTELLEKVEALERINDNHPLNADIAVARLKKYIVKEEGKILLHDLLYNEQENVYKKIQEINDFHIYPDTHLLPRLEFYEQCLEILLPLIIHGVYWAKPEHEDFFINILSRLSEPSNKSFGRSYDDTRWFHYYPVMILIYALGISSIKSSNFSLLNKIFNIKIAEDTGDFPRKLCLIEKVNSQSLDARVITGILGNSYLTSLSTVLEQKLKPSFSQVIFNQLDFKDTFDIFEYLLSLNYLHIVGDNIGFKNWVPLGLYKKRNFYRLRTDKNYPLKAFFDMAEIEKEEWLPIKSGIFSGSFDVYTDIKKRADEFLSSLPIQ
jgi:hypothetical protein